MPGKPQPVELEHLPAWQRRFAIRLRELRLKKSLRGYQVAALLGVTTKHATGWERGESKPSIDQVLELADILGVSFADLTGIGLDE